MRAEAQKDSVFTGQVAVVTGASSGIGRATALALAQHGVALYLVGRQRERMEPTAESARAMGCHVWVQEADLAHEKDIRELVNYLTIEIGRVDLLIHSAGVIARGATEVAPLEDLDWQYEINVRAPYLLTQQLLPMLKELKGQIVFVNSSVGLTARGGVGQYAATKHALKAFADALRDEVNAYGVRVLSLYLGRTATPMQAAVCESQGTVYRPEHLLQPEDVAEIMVAALSLPRP
jgi:short-subunit dehydrogenase